MNNEECYRLASAQFALSKARWAHNYKGSKKTKYRFQVICNRCHARGKPIKTDFLIDCHPWSSVWSGRYSKNVQQTELVRPWAEAAIDAWNRRANDESKNPKNP